MEKRCLYIYTYIYIVRERDRDRDMKNEQITTKWFWGSPLG